MGSTDFGKFENFCRDSTLPICNILSDQHNQAGPWGGCELEGIPLSGDRHLTNLGTIVLCALAIAVAAFLVLRSEAKQAAVGRREMQLFLVGFIIIQICEIFTVGGIPLSDDVIIAFTGIHIGMITATTWILMINGLVGYQLLDDGTPLSIAMVVGSSLVFFVGTGYIALDTGFEWTSQFSSSYDLPNTHIALYVLYQVVPLVFLVAFFVLETVLVLKVLGEIRPMLYLVGSAILFAAGQVFNYVASPHICNGTSGAIDGSLFQTLFTLMAIVMVWIFWSSITEDDWPNMNANAGYP